MAKTIKFNLICDGKPIRTIEDLQNNFSVEDILAYYDNKLLHRWLEVRGYEKELGEVNKINAVTSVDKIKCLAKIFEIDTEEEKIADAIYTIEKIASKQDLYAEYEKNDFDPKVVLDKYMYAYNSLVKQIISNRDDFEKVKSLVEELITKHYSVFEKNYLDLFIKFYVTAQSAILALLIFEKSRNLYIDTNLDNLKRLYGSNSKNNFDKSKYIYKMLCSMKYSELPVSKAYLQNTEYKVIAPNNHKCMILETDKDEYISFADASKKNGFCKAFYRFTILNGLSACKEYSWSDSNIVYYLEVE